MKELVNSIIYIFFSSFVILITLLILTYVKPINHTHDKELEKLLIDTTWVTNGYYNDEPYKIELIFHKDKTITYRYAENNKVVDNYYEECNTFKWSKEKRTLDIICKNSKENSKIEIYSITKDKLEIKMHNDKYMKLKKAIQ